MRILVVTNMYPPHHFGGYELSCQDAVRRFEEAGHDVTVLTSTIRVDGVPGDDPAQVRRELRLYWDDHRLISPPVRQRLGIELHNRRALERAMAASQPDVVSVWNMGAVSLGLLATLRRTGRPVVYVIGDDWPNYAPDLDAWSRLFRGGCRVAVGRLFTALTGVATVASDFSDLGPCLFNSRAMLDAVRRAGTWTMPATGIVYTGVETEDFPVAGDDEPVSARPWRGRVLFVGRIDERKGIQTIVEALPMLAGADLRVLGRGDDELLRQLRARADSLGVGERITWSAAGRAALSREYRDADVLVFSSVYAEPFGIVPLEAMTCDTPVVATGTGGSGEYLADGWNCLLYPPGDAAALAAAVNRLATDAGLRERLVRGGRRTARQLTTEAWMDSLSAWHAAAADRFRTGTPPDRQVRVGDG